MPRFVNVGGITKTDLLAKLNESRVRLNALAQDLFDSARFTTAPSAYRVDVVGTTVAGLGLLGGGTYVQVLQRAHVQGLAVCPLELAPHLRMQWSDQPESLAAHTTEKNCAPPDSITVASVAPLDEQDIPWGFYLRRHEGTAWLRGYRSWSGHVWSSSDRFAFIRSSNAA